MSWWAIAIVVFVLLRVVRRSREARGVLRTRYGEFPPWPGRSWRGGAGQPGDPALPASPAPPLPDPRQELERTIAATREAYVAGRMTVEEYERKLDELYRTAEGKRLREP